MDCNEMETEMRRRIATSRNYGRAIISETELNLLLPAWRPIAEAPIPPAAEAGDWWTFPCLLQDARGIVGEGFCRYVTDNRYQGRKAYRMLRWYRGASDRPGDARVCAEPRYFQPLPQPRKD